MKLQTKSLFFGGPCGERKEDKKWSPKGARRGFWRAPGEPVGRPWTAKGWPRTLFLLGETDDFQEGDQNDVSETKEHDKKEWALVVDKRALQKRSKIIIFDDPPWPKSGFYERNMMV